MTTDRLVARTALLLALAALGVGASGCISLFPKTKPSQLYRFGYVGPDAPPCPQAGAAGVVVGPPLFPKEAGNDQLLSVTGSEAAYIAESRWVSPASSLFQDAVEHAFQSSCAVRLVRRQDFGAGVATLRLDLDRFETDYSAPGAVPTVKVTLKATLLKKGGDFAAERFFMGAETASENRVGPIVAAYSAATTQALTDLRAWTETNATKVAAEDAEAESSRALPPPPPSPPRARSTSSSTTTNTQERRVEP